MGNEATGDNAREDWDFVSLENYTKDTKYLVDIANAIADNLGSELKQTKLLLAAAISTMGRIVIDRNTLLRADEAKIARYERPDLDQIILEVEKQDAS